VVGDGEAEGLLDSATVAFASLRGEGAVEPPRAPEPSQHGERRVVVRRAAGALPIVQLAFRAPAAQDPAAPALALLSRALAPGGGAGGEGVASARSSRLYRALVERGLATAVEATFQLMKDPYLFWIEATLRPDVPHAEVERIMLAELERIRTEDLSDEEFARVRRQALAAAAYPSDTITGRAYQLGQLLATAAAGSIAEWYERLATATRAQVREAAAATLVERSRSVGWFVPEPE
jgi:zinc protease